MTDQSPSSYFDTSSEAQSRRGKRRQGSRAKLAQRFFEDTYAAWEEQGPSVLARAAFHDPVAFANMVARLMPQKIEVSTPTDGMSDERLAEMLEFAERMAGLKAQQAKVIQGDAMTHSLNHENGAAAVLLEGGGGGPLLEEGGGGIYTPHTTPADPAKSPDRSSENTTKKPSNPLNATFERADIETIKERVRALPPLFSEEQKSHTPYPVGRAVPLQDHEVERRNRAALDDPIDPESLF